MGWPKSGVLEKNISRGDLAKKGQILKGLWPWNENIGFEMALTKRSVKWLILQNYCKFEQELLQMESAFIITNQSKIYCKLGR